MPHEKQFCIKCRSELKITRDDLKRAIRVECPGCKMVWRRDPKTGGASITVPLHILRGGKP